MLAATVRSLEFTIPTKLLPRPVAKLTFVESRNYFYCTLVSLSLKVGKANLWCRHATVQNLLAPISQQTTTAIIEIQTTTTTPATTTMTIKTGFLYQQLDLKGDQQLHFSLLNLSLHALIQSKICNCCPTNFSFRTKNLEGKSYISAISSFRSR